MKTLMKTFFTAILLISASAFTKAETKIARLSNIKNCVNTYIETITEGNLNDIEILLNDNFQYYVNCKGNLTTYSKDQLVTFLNGIKNIKQNCKTSYTILDEDDNFSIARIEMKYENFTKIDYITLCREGNNWKVNQIFSTYP